jgi:signal recognition particle GTPase
MSYVDPEKQKEYKKKYREENEEKIKKYREENKEKIKEQRKKYREENKEKIKEQRKKYKEENKEKIKEWNKKYYQENKERINERCKKYNKENKEKLNAQRKKYREEDRGRHMAQQIRYRANEKNLPYDLDADYLKSIWPEDNKCPALGLEFSKPGEGLKENSSSLDRLVPELGYVKGNVAIVSMLANQIMSNATPDQVIAVGYFFKNKLEEKNVI